MTIHAEPIRSARRGRDLLAGFLAAALLGAFAAARLGAAQEADRDLCADEGTFSRALADTDRGDLDAARKGFEAARASFKLALDLPCEIESLYRVGRLLKNQGKADLAIEAFEEALPLVDRLLPLAAKDADAALVCGKVWNLLGFTLLGQGNIKDARRYIEQAVELARCWPADPRFPYSSWARNLANVEAKAGDFPTARRLYLELLALPISDGLEIARLNILLGFIESSSGNVDDARRYLDQAEGFAFDDPRIGWQVWHERCAISSRLGLLDEALDQCAIALIRAKSDPDWEAQTLNLLGSLSSDLGSYESALQSFARSREIFRQLNLAGPESNSLCNFGFGQAQLGRFDEAQKSFAEAAKLAARVGNSGSEGFALYLQGRVALQRTAHGSRAEVLAAHAVLTKALDRMSQAGDVPGQADAQLELAGAETRLGDFPGALGRLDLAFALAQKLEDPVRRAAVLTRRAEILAESGKLEPGLAAIQDAVREIDDLRTRVASPPLRATFFASRRRTFELQIEILLRLAKLHPDSGFEIQAFEASEAARARSLLDLLVERSLAQGRNANPVLAGLVRQGLDLDRELNLAQAQSRTAPAEPKLPERERLDRRIATLEANLQEVERRLRITDPRYAAVRYARALGARDIQRELSDHEILLEYVFAADAAYLFAVTREQVRALPLDQPAIAKILPPFRARLAGGQGLEQALRIDARKLYDLLLAPAAELLTGKDRLIVAADGDLYFLPFEVLISPAPPGASPSYLIETKTISYTPSASVLARLGELPVGDAFEFVGVAVGDPKDGSAVLAKVDDEVRGIAALYPAERSRLLLDGAATEAGLSGLHGALSGARRIHFATHGYLSDDPQRMGLRLAPDPSGGDGLLQAFEVLRLDLHADLVVLSACETAVGQQVPGEGVIGLPRAFFYAGARSVAVSLWRAPDDATARLMTSFYGHLQQGQDKAEALRQAKLEQIRDRQRPFLWAPFVLVGSPIR
ncbi:MAG: CHAT domain-containing protein [Acidobacteriota bacterium]